ncbi:MAG: hypothetical protein U5K70_06830 [Halodesulfurarchaeum sp.]|nr:hypothetical protein [Halodesulfurarchaeum sp.]
MTGRDLSVETDRYRWLDVGTKLAGVSVIAIGLETGIESAPGLAIALAGVLLGVSTVFITRQS